MKKIVMLAIIIAGLCSCSQKIVPSSEIKTEKFLATDSVLHFSTFFKNNGFYVVDQHFGLKVFPLSDINKAESVSFCYFEPKKIKLVGNLKKQMDKSKVVGFTLDVCLSILYKTLYGSFQKPKFLNKDKGNFFLLANGTGIRVSWVSQANYWFLDYGDNYDYSIDKDDLIFCKGIFARYKYVAVTTTKYKKVKVN